jgi:hypothetical protein
MERWDAREARGPLSSPTAPRVFHLEPSRHHELAERLQGKKRGLLSLSAERCMDRARRDHEDLLSEFGSLLAGVEQDAGRHGHGCPADYRRRTVSGSEARPQPGIRRPKRFAPVRYSLQYR